MNTLEIVQIGCPVLRTKAKALSKEQILSPSIQSLIQEMKDTMHAAPGVGLAAPQIGRSLQLAVIEDKPDYLQSVPATILKERDRKPVEFHVIINPRLTIESEVKADFYEGCLSIHGFLGKVNRALSVKVECLNEKAEPVTIHAQGWYARILQHEIDHLHGILCIDRMNIQSLTTLENYQRYHL